MANRFPRRLLINTINVQRTTGSSVDERGIESNTWANATSSVKCRLTMLSESEDRDGRNTIVESLTLYFGETVDVKASDRIKDGTKYYEIIAINTVRDSKGDDCYTVASCLFRE